jgi:hypothetical protein
MRSLARTKGQDALLDLYKAQLSAYALMCPGNGYGDIERSGLIYFEPATDDTDDQAFASLRKDGFGLNFKVTPVEIDIDTGNIEKLLKVARKLYDLTLPPECKDGCKDCDSVATLYRLCRSVETVEAAKHRPTQDALVLRAQLRFEERQFASAQDALHHEEGDIPSLLNFADLLDWSEPDSAVPLVGVGQ